MRPQECRHCGVLGISRKRWCDRPRDEPRPYLRHLLCDGAHEVEIMLYGLPPWGDKQKEITE